MSTSTLPDGASTYLLDFVKSEDTLNFLVALNELLLELAQDWDLSLLDGVTVTWDFAKGLKSIDREPDAAEITFTDNTDLKCVAKVVPVQRAGLWKVHVVYNAPFVLPLCEPSYEDHAEARQIVAHECAHVAERKWWLDAFPERRLNQGYEDSVGALLLGTADIMWSEYAACRLTAPYTDADALTTRYAHTLGSVSQRLQSRISPAFEVAKQKKIAEVLLRDVGALICEPLRLMAYLHGHLDGANQRLPIDQLCPGLPDEYVRLWDALRAALRRVWATRGAWKTYPETFDELRGIAEAAMNARGIFFGPAEDGSTAVYVQ